MRWVFICLFALGFIAVGCSPAQPSAGRARNPLSAQPSVEDNLRHVREARTPFIAVVSTSAPTTGEVGRSMVMGVELALERHAGILRKAGLSIVKLDDRSDPNVAARLGHALAQQPNLVAVIGSVDSQCTRALAQALARRPVPPPLLSPVSTRSELGADLPWFFRVNLTSRLMVETVVAYLYTHRQSSIPARTAAIFVDTYYGRGVARDLKQVCSEQPIWCTFVGQWGYTEPQALAMTSRELERIVDQLDLWQVQVVGLFGHNRESGRLAALIKERLPHVHRFVVTGNSTYDFAHAGGPGGVDGVLVASSFSAAVNSSRRAHQFLEAFARRHPDVQPDTFAAQGYDAGLALSAALDDVGGLPYAPSQVVVAGDDAPWLESTRSAVDQRRLALRAAIAAVDIASALGAPIRFKDTIRPLDPRILRWQGGELVPIQQRPPTNRSHSPQVVAFVLGILLVCLLMMLAHLQLPLAAKWLPLTVGLGSTVGTPYLGLPVDPLSLAVTVAVGSLLVFTGFGLWGRQFPALGRAEPFLSLQYVLLRSGSFRRLFYRRLVLRQREAIAAERFSANRESYVSLPANLEYYKKRSVEPTAQHEAQALPPLVPSGPSPYGPGERTSPRESRARAQPSTQFGAIYEW